MREKPIQYDGPRQADAHSLPVRNAALGVELETLRRQVAEEAAIDAEIERLRADNLLLRQENERLTGELAQTASNRPEARLRAALTSRKTTTAELRSVIGAVEVLVDEARRELSSSQLRDRRAAFERLYSAIAAGEEDELESALEQARAAHVESEDLDKGQTKLEELRALTPEERTAKAARQAQLKRKKDAFLYVKKDDVDTLRSLIEGFEEGVRWQDWKDYAGRSLWRCAQDLHAVNVEEYLNGLDGDRPKTYIESSRRLQRLPVQINGHDRRSVYQEPQCTIVQQLSEVSQDSLPAKAGRKLSGLAEPQLHKRNDVDVSEALKEGHKEVTSCPATEAPPEPKIRQPAIVNLLQPEWIEVEESHKESTPSPAAAGSSPATRAPGPKAHQTTIVNLLDAEVEWREESESPKHPEKKPPPPKQLDDHPELRSKAFRAVVQDDCDALTEVLDAVDMSVWSAWQNKAGQDLLTLSEVRQSCYTYAVLAGALGILKEYRRVSFCDAETVWVFEHGEVMPRRATVKQDTNLESETVLVEFWDGDEPSQHVDRCMVQKMKD